MYIDFPVEDSALSLGDSYLEMEVVLEHNVPAGFLWSGNDLITLVNLGPIVFLVRIG